MHAEDATGPAILFFVPSRDSRSRISRRGRDPPSEEQ